MAEDLPGRGDAELEQALVDLGTNIPHPPTSDLSGAVLERIGAGGPPPDQPSSSALASLQGPLGLAVLAVGLVAMAILTLAPSMGSPLVDRSEPRASTAGDPIPASQKVVVYGGDLTEAERRELAASFGIADPAADTVTREELAAALRAAGLPVAPTDRAISSTVLTCLGQGEGLRIRTEHITRVPAASYANALLAAGVDDGSVIIAAPPTNPVSGETALVGVLKAFRRCPGGRQPESARVRLPYEQLSATAALAGETEDFGKPSTVMLRAMQAVITGQARDDASIGAALDVAAAHEGVPMTPSQRSEVVSFLSKLRDLDYGAYARGYRIEQRAPNEVNVVPVGAGETSNAAWLTPVSR